MSEGAGPVGVYVIHWRSPDRLLEAVRSLSRTIDVDLEVTIVDNASGPESIAALTDALGPMRVIDTGANRGYAGAANVAFADARDRRLEAVVLAAHDVLVEPTTLRGLVDALRASPSHAIVGPAHWDPSFTRPESVGGRVRAWAGGPLIPPAAASPPDVNGIVDTSFVSGALMAIRPSLLQQIAGMDERLFAYWEDVELCLQAASLGHRVGVVPAARAAETGYGADHETHAFLIARNHLLVARAHLGWTALAVATTAVLARATRAAVGSILPTRDAGRRATSRQFAVGRWRGLLAGLGGRGGPPPDQGAASAAPSTARFEPIDPAPPASSHATARVVRPRLLRRLFPVLERLGVHVTPVHFYQPVPDTSSLPADLWERRSDLVGVDLRREDQLALLAELAAWSNTVEPLPVQPTGEPHRFHVANHTFGEVDAEVYRFLVHRHRPRRIVEIGSGYSTMLAAQALLEVAEQHSESPGELTAIEPYPSEVLRRGFPGLTRLVTSTDLRTSAAGLVGELEAGDVLFIDSTHVLHIASDVRTELLELVPSVAPGVLVHFHDIFLPAEYPRRWVLENRWFWTEQYALQAFLTGNSTFEVVWGSHLMHLEQPELISAAVASYDPNRSAPGSFWVRRSS